MPGFDSLMLRQIEWTDEFYSLGHNEWKQYQSNSIINLGRIMAENNIEINMKNVKSFIEQRIA